MTVLVPALTLPALFCPLPTIQSPLEAVIDREKEVEVPDVVEVAFIAEPTPVKTAIVHRPIPSVNEPDHVVVWVPVPVGTKYHIEFHLDVRPAVLSRTVARVKDSPFQVIPVTSWFEPEHKVAIINRLAPVLPSTLTLLFVDPSVAEYRAIAIL